MNHKNRNFFKFMLLWAGELISAIGSGLTSFGLGVYVFRQTGSAADMALVTLLGFLPSFLLSIPAGVLADRYDRRLLMMIGDGCSALGILFFVSGGPVYGRIWNPGKYVSDMYVWISVLCNASICQ